MNWNKEVKNGTRFKFGENWNNYLSNLNEYQINKARDELFKWLGDLNGKTFLDIGSGSGLHSLVARQLGATVFSLDFDKKSVECTKYLKEKYFLNDKDWLPSYNFIMRSKVND